ncbi:hypothetical protein [Streptomyces sp. NPDC048643]|uniref:hypothetical protein n=1 Tax=Streptomyces sp. NPDC048643 TaxID=3155637 RepID=UPI00344AD48A
MSGTVANDITASGDRNRLTRRNPGARLARDLLKTEYGLRNQGPGGAGRADGESIWDRIAAELRRLLDRITGGSRSAPAGGGIAPGGGEGGGPGGDGSLDQAAAPGRGGPGQPPSMAPPAPTTPPVSPERPVHAGMARLEEHIRRLPAHEREAFEDTVLHLVRTDRKYRKAFEKSPESMPLVARCVVNAHLREVAPDVAAADKSARRQPSTRQGAPGDETRSRWERPAQTRSEPAVSLVPPSSRTSFDAPRPDETTDAFSFEAADRTNLAERTSSATLTPRESDLFAGQSFLAAENGGPGLRSGDDTFAPAPGLEPPVSPLPERSHPVSPVPSDAALVSPLPDHARLASPTVGREALVSPLPSQATPVPRSPTFPASPLGPEGHQVLRDTRDAFPTASTSGGSDTSTRSTAPAHGGRIQPVQNPVRRK